MAPLEACGEPCIHVYPGKAGMLRALVGRLRGGFSSINPGFRGPKTRDIPGDFSCRGCVSASQPGSGINPQRSVVGSSAPVDAGAAAVGATPDKTAPSITAAVVVAVAAEQSVRKTMTPVERGRTSAHGQETVSRACGARRRREGERALAASGGPTAVAPRVVGHDRPPRGLALVGG